MTTGATVIRILLGVIGIGLVIGGIAVALGAADVPGAFVGAFAMLVAGVVLLIAAIIEVTRYRSESAERSGLDPGPGGGESSPLEARFRRTDEVFVDPTTQLRIRVFVDPGSGERRYVAER